jgi:hypothetical protein
VLRPFYCGGSGGAIKNSAATPQFERENCCSAVKIAADAARRNLTLCLPLHVMERENLRRRYLVFKVRYRQRSMKRGEQGDILGGILVGFQYGHVARSWNQST